MYGLLGSALTGATTGFLPRSAGFGTGLTGTGFLASTGLPRLAGFGTGLTGTGFLASTGFLPRLAGLGTGLTGTGFLAADTGFFCGLAATGLVCLPVFWVRPEVLLVFPVVLWVRPVVL